MRIKGMRRSVIFVGATILMTAAACSQGEDPLLVEPSANVEKLQLAADDSKERADAAEARAADAEARAAAAEARIECERDRQEASNRGAVIGGVAGAVLGSQVAGDGAKSEGGVIGGAAGVLTGRQIAKKDHRC
jgi:uncharacterized protein YcfJ